MKLRVGVVGLGKAWETRHAPALRALADRFEVRAFCDPVAHRAAEVAHRWPARTCDGFRALAESDDIDAVLLLSARWYGRCRSWRPATPARRSIAPPRSTSTRTKPEEVRQRVRDAGVAFMAEFPCRLAPATLRLKELMATRLGRPRLLFCNRRHTRRRDSAAIYTSDMRQLIEMVDWCRDVVGEEASSVVGRPTLRSPPVRPAERPAKDYLVMTLDFSPQRRDRHRRRRPDRLRQLRRRHNGTRRPPSAGLPTCKSSASAASRFSICPTRSSGSMMPGQHSELLDHDRPVGEQLLMHFHRQVEQPGAQNLQPGRRLQGTHDRESRVKRAICRATVSSW